MMTLYHAALRADLSESRMRKLCRDGRIPGATKRAVPGSVYPVWEVPDNFCIMPGKPPGNPNFRRKD